VRAVAVHAAVVGEGMEMRGLIESPQLGKVEGRHAAS
jgi:hypothetical protein